MKFKPARKKIGQCTGTLLKLIHQEKRTLDYLAWCGTKLPDIADLHLGYTCTLRLETDKVMLASSEQKYLTCELCFSEF